MMAFKVTTKKTPSQPAGLTKVFVQTHTPTIQELRDWLLKEYGVKSGAGSCDFIIEKA